MTDDIKTGGVPATVAPAQVMPVTPPVITAKAPKHYDPLQKRDFIFGILYLIASYVLVAMGLFGEFRLGFVIAYVAIFAVNTLYLSGRGVRPDAFTVICGILSLAGAATLALYCDGFVNFIMFMLVSGLYTTYGIGLVRGFSHNPGSYRMLFDLLRDAFCYPFSKMHHIVGGIRSVSIKGKKSLYGIFGVLVALPVMAVLVVLLVQSDAAFEGLVNSLGRNIGICLLYLLMAIAVMPYFFSSAYAKRNALGKRTGARTNRRDGLPSVACASFLGAISVVYVVYLFSQLAYFFSAFRGILPAGYKYTASAFARRGFFEMFAICAINILLVSVVTAVSNKKSMAIKLISCFISLFSVLLIVTAMQKMRLNISIYGLSKNRVMVAVFMLMMLVVIAFFIIHIFAPRIAYMQPIIIICSAIFIALSFADIDARIAEYNISAYQSGATATLDVENLGTLSDSALPYIEQLAHSDDADISRCAMIILGEHMAKHYHDYLDDGSSTDGLRSYNYAQAQARRLFDKSDLADAIVSTAKLCDADNIWYSDDDNVFEYYDDNGNTKTFGYNPVTHAFDKIVRYDIDGNVVK